MRAAIFDQFGGPLEVRQVLDPVATPTGVVVRVEATGMCRSDWHAWAGHDPDVAVPHVPGHELAGTIESIGAEVGQLQVGQRVTVPFVCGCGRCEWCARGAAQVCPDQTQPGFTGWGSFAELVALEAADFNVIALPDELTAAAAASLGCRFATAYRALVGRARIQPGEWLAVLGCGGVGLSAVLVAKALGARVVAVDRARISRQLAAELGADATIDAVGTDVPAEIRGLTGGGAHVSLDAVGSESTSADSVLALRRRGRQVQVGLLPAVQGRPAMPMERVIAYELDLLGSHGMAAADYPGMLELVRTGVLRPDRLIGATIGLRQAARELPMMGDRPSSGITIVDPRLN